MRPSTMTWRCAPSSTLPSSAAPKARPHDAATVTVARAQTVFIFIANLPKTAAAGSQPARLISSTGVRKEVVADPGRLPAVAEAVEFAPGVAVGVARLLVAAVGVDGTVAE